jgi:GNAT superfamily N-acetyltransferase
MDAAEILSRYDREERELSTAPDVVREATEHVVRHVSLIGREDLIIYSDLSEENADEVIQHEYEYFFLELGHSFQWRYHQHDRPADLLDRLLRFGFFLLDESALMALDLDELPETLKQPLKQDVRRVSIEGLQDVLTIIDDGQCEYRTEVAESLDKHLREQPEILSAYVAYVDGVPASCGWTYFNPGSSFASLWGGTTRPGYRGRGLYTSLVAARAQEAKERGSRFLVVNAGPMSQPILERLGFVVLTMIQPCRWL